MRWVIGLWVVPLVLFWGWYALASNDFGYIIFSRLTHDQVFAIYGNALGVDPAVIPGWFAKACLLDSAIVGAILAIAKRRSILAWWRRRQSPEAEASLSSAP